MRALCGLLVIVGLSMSAAQAAEQKATRFVVYFQQWSAALDDNALDVIAKAADLMKSNSRNHASVQGYADTTGSSKANILLSDLRAQIVVDQLLADGAASNHIRQKGHGSVAFMLNAQESRRVEIAITQ